MWRTHFFWFWVYLIMIVGPEVVLVGLWPWIRTIKSQSGVARIRLRHRFLFRLDILWHFMTFRDIMTLRFDIVMIYTLILPIGNFFPSPRCYDSFSMTHRPFQKAQILGPLVEKLPSCSNNDSSHVKFTLLTWYALETMFVNQKLVGSCLPQFLPPKNIVFFWE